MNYIKTRYILYVTMSRCNKTNRRAFYLWAMINISINGSALLSQSTVIVHLTSNCVHLHHRTITNTGIQKQFHYPNISLESVCMCPRISPCIFWQTQLFSSLLNRYIEDHLCVNNVSVLSVVCIQWAKEQEITIWNKIGSRCWGD